MPIESPQWQLRRDPPPHAPQGTSRSGDIHSAGPPGPPFAQVQAYGRRGQRRGFLVLRQGRSKGRESVHTVGELATGPHRHGNPDRRPRQTVAPRHAGSGFARDPNRSGGTRPCPWSPAAPARCSGGPCRRPHLGNPPDHRDAHALVHVADASPFSAVPEPVRIDRSLEFAAGAVKEVLGRLAAVMHRLPAFTRTARARSSG